MMNRRQMHASGWTLIEMMVVILVVSILVALSLSVGSAVLQGSESQRTQNSLSVLQEAFAARTASSVSDPMVYGIDNDPPGSSYPIDLWEVLNTGSGCANCPALDNLNYSNGADFPSEEELQCAMWLQVYGCGTVDSSDDAYRGVAANCFWMMANHPDSREIIASLEPSLLKSARYLLPNGVTEDAIMPFDVWGTPILVVLPGRPWDDRLDGASGPFGSKRQDEDQTIRTKEEQLLGSALQGQAYFISAGPDGRFGNLHNDKRLIDGFTPNPTDEGYQDALDNLYSYEVHTW